MTSRPTHNFPPTLPGTGGDCSWNTTVTPALGFAVYTQCAGALSVQTAFATWDTDNRNTGTLNLPPLIIGSDKVCLGNNVNMMFNDNTVLNCRLAIEPLTPNTQQRFIKIVYGSSVWGAPSNIPDIRVTLPATLGGATVQVTNNNATGTLIFPSGFFATTGSADGNGAILVPAGVTIASTGTQYMGTITTTATNFQAVGQRLYVKLLYWDFCNPYNGIDDTGAEFIENFVEIVTKPIPLQPLDFHFASMLPPLLILLR